MTFDRYTFITLQDLLDLITIYASMPQSTQEPIGFTLAYDYEGFFYLRSDLSMWGCVNRPQEPRLWSHPGCLRQLSHA